MRMMMSIDHSYRSVAYVFALILSLAVLTACGADGSPDDSAQRARQNEVATADKRSSDQPITHGSMDIPVPGADIADVTNESEIVVRGTVVEVDEDVRHAKDPSGTAGSTIYTVQVDETLVGTPVDEIRISVFTHSDGEQIRVFDYESRELVPEIDVHLDDTAVWFLDQVDPQFDFDGYVLAHVYGLVTASDDGALGTVGAMDPESPFGQEVSELGSLDAIEERIRELQ